MAGWQRHLKMAELKFFFWFDTVFIYICPGGIKLNVLITLSVG